MKNKPEIQDITFWKSHLPIGSRVSYGAWGRGTVCSFNAKPNIHRVPYAQVLVLFDGNRYFLTERGMSMTAACPTKLKDNAVIRFGKYCAGRLSEDQVYLGDIIEFDNQIYRVKDSVYDGKIYKTYLVPDIDNPWYSANLANGIWIDRDETNLKIIEKHDPYKGREGTAPDSVDILLRDIQTPEDFQTMRKIVVELFNKEFTS